MSDVASAIYRTKWAVQYYETDRMGIVHHSNYVRWMETARVDFLEDIGVPLSRMEEEGIVVPVVDISVKYKRPALFGEIIQIELEVLKYTGVRVQFGYRMLNNNDEIVCTGTSTHAFTEVASLRVLSLARQWPALHEKMTLITEGRALWEENPPCAPSSL